MRLWRLVVHRNKQGAKRELFDLSKDPSEKTELAAEQSARVEALSAQLAAEQARDNDALPK